MLHPLGISSFHQVGNSDYHFQALEDLEDLDQRISGESLREAKTVPPVYLEIDVSLATWLLKFIQPTDFDKLASFLLGINSPAPISQC